MPGLTDRQRIDLERFLMQQAHEKPKRSVASLAYRRMHPRNAYSQNVLVGDIVRNAKPRLVWYSRHALFRPDGALTKTNIDTTISRGTYLTNRNRYFNSKGGGWQTNRGMMAPLTNGVTCPTRRISNGHRTVVLSFCYPRDFARKNWAPEVVTAYSNLRMTT